MRVIDSEVATRRVCDLLDTLIAIRIDVGHGANGVAASPVLSHLLAALPPSDYRTSPRFIAMSSKRGANRGLLGVDSRWWWPISNCH